MANDKNLIPITSATAKELGAKGGRNKKGSKHLSTWIQELMEDEEFEATIQQGLKIVEYKGAPIKAIIKAQMQKAINGDTKAFDSLGKYGWSLKQEIDLTSNGETVAQPIDGNLLNQFLSNVNDNTKR